MWRGKKGQFAESKLPQDFETCIGSRQPQRQLICRKHSHSERDMKWSTTNMFFLGIYLMSILMEWKVYLKSSRQAFHQNKTGLLSKAQSSRIPWSWIMEWRLDIWRDRWGHGTGGEHDRRFELTGFLFIMFVVSMVPGRDHVWKPQGSMQYRFLCYLCLYRPLKYTIYYINNTHWIGVCHFSPLFLPIHSTSVTPDGFKMVQKDTPNGSTLPGRTDCCVVVSRPVRIQEAPWLLLFARGDLILSENPHAPNTGGLGFAARLRWGAIFFVSGVYKWRLCKVLEDLPLQEPTLFGSFECS